MPPHTGWCHVRLRQSFPLTCEEASSLWRSKVIQAVCALNIVAPDVLTEATCDVNFECGSLVLTADYNTVTSSSAVNLAAKIGAATSTLEAASEFYGVPVTDPPLVSIDVLSPSPPPPTPSPPSPPTQQQLQETDERPLSMLLIICMIVAGTVVCLIGIVVLYCCLCRDSDEDEDEKAVPPTTGALGQASQASRGSQPRGSAASRGSQQRGVAGSRPESIGMPESTRSESPVNRDRGGLYTSSL